MTQAALRVCGSLWALDANLAHQRHFPAVDWETSYTLYDALLAPWFDQRFGAEWRESRAALMVLLQREHRPAQCHEPRGSQCA